MVLRAPPGQLAPEADAADERVVLPRGRDPGSPLPRPRAGRPLRVPPRDRPGRRARPQDRADVHRGHRRGQPGRRVHPRLPRPRVRGPHGHPLLLPRDDRVRPRRPRRAHGSLERRARRSTMELEQPDPVRAGRRSSPDHGRRRPTRPGAPGGLRRRRRPRAHACRLGRHASADRRVTRRAGPRAAHRSMDGRRRCGSGSAGRRGRERRGHGTRSGPQGAARDVLDGLRLRR